MMRRLRPCCHGLGLRLPRVTGLSVHLSLRESYNGLMVYNTKCTPMGRVSVGDRKYDIGTAIQLVVRMWDGKKNGWVHMVHGIGISLPPIICIHPSCLPREGMFPVQHQL